MNSGRSTWTPTSRFCSGKRPCSSHTQSLRDTARPGRRSRDVVSKEELLKEVWPNSFVEESNLSQNIFLLRKALGDTAENRQYIVTLPGRGYRFAASVRTVPEQGETLVAQARTRTQIVIEENEAETEQRLKTLPYSSKRRR